MRDTVRLYAQPAAAPARPVARVTLGDEGDRGDAPADAPFYLLAVEADDADQGRQIRAALQQPFITVRRPTAVRTRSVRTRGDAPVQEPYGTPAYWGAALDRLQAEAGLRCDPADYDRLLAALAAAVPATRGATRGARGPIDRADAQRACARYLLHEKGAGWWAGKASFDEAADLWTVAVHEQDAGAEPVGYVVLDAVGDIVPDERGQAIRPPVEASVGARDFVQTRGAVRTRGPAEGTAAPRVPGYHLTRHLGKGRFGDVWQGAGTALARETAVKILQGGCFSAAGFGQLAQDAGLLAGLAPHPGRAQVHAFTRVGAGALLETQYVAGSVLEDAAGAVPWEAAARYVADVADGLRGAHAVGVFHGDIKPANILLDPRADQAVLTDFGLALRADVGAATPALTPGYAAPEAAASFSAKADVFALAATLYHLLTGQVPPAPAGPRHRLALRHVPRALAEAVLAGLAPDPGPRPDLDTFVGRIRGAHAAALADRLLELSRAADLPGRLVVRVLVSAGGGQPLQPVTPASVPLDPDRAEEDLPPPAPVVSVRGTGTVRIEVTAGADGFHAALAVDPGGALRVLDPVLPGQDGVVRAGETRAVACTLEPESGPARVVLLWEHAPYLVGAVLGSEWAGGVVAPAVAARVLESLVRDAAAEEPTNWGAEVIAFGR